jgi:hypothetical protein
MATRGPRAGRGRAREGGRAAVREKASLAAAAPRPRTVLSSLVPSDKQAVLHGRGVSSARLAPQSPRVNQTVEDGRLVEYRGVWRIYTEIWAGGCAPAVAGPHLGLYSCLYDHHPPPPPIQNHLWSPCTGRCGLRGPSLEGEVQKPRFTSMIGPLSPVAGRHPDREQLDAMARCRTGLRDWGRRQLCCGNDQILESFAATTRLCVSLPACRSLESHDLAQWALSDRTPLPPNDVFLMTF